MLEVIIMQGVSGSGKTTYIKNNFPNATVVSADHFFINASTGTYEFDSQQLGTAHGECLKKYFDIVTTWNNDDCKDNVLVVDNTNTTVAEIAPYAAIALAYGHKLKIVYLNVDPKVAAMRNIHGVEESHVVLMHEKISRCVNDFPARWPREVIDC